MVRTGMLALSAGLALAAFLPIRAEQAGYGVAALLPAIALVPLWSWLRCYPRVAGLLVLISLVSAGTGLALWRSHLYHERLLPASWEGRDFWVRGVVTGLPASDPDRTRFRFHIRQSCLTLLPDQCPAEPGGFAQRHIHLSVYDQDLTIRPGQHWWLRVRLRRPGGTVNPGVMERQLQWFRDGVSAVGYVRPTTYNRMIGSGWPGLSRWRYWLLDRLQLPERHDDRMGLVHALVAGERTGISDAQWQLFSDTGTSHLVVISGLHVGFVAWTVYALAGLVLRRVPRLLVRWPAPRIAAGAALCAATVYAGMAGFSLPTRRALVMLAVVLAGRLSGRCHPASSGFSVALLLVLLLDPLAVLSAGFWYSFTAVGVLLLAFAVRGIRSAQTQTGPGAVWERWGRSQWVVFLGLLVPMMVWQGSVSVIAPLVNLFAIPLVSLLIVPLCLVAAVVAIPSPGMAMVPLVAAAWLLEWLERGLTVFREWAGELAVHTLPVLPWPAVVCTVLAVLLLLLPAGWPLRWLALPLAGPLLLFRPVSLDADTARVLIVDVGQGLGVIIQTSNHTLVYDTGPGDFLLSRVLGHEMRSLGHRRVHTVITSHGHADHISGLAGIEKQFRIDQHLTSDPPSESSSGACQSGQRWKLDGVRFRILHPAPLDSPAGRRHGNSNNRSCVLRVQAGEESILLTGDIEAEAEAQLVRRQPGDLPADILLIPHHGSDSSSTHAFIGSVSPSLAFFSASSRNRFGHPAESVLSRYRQGRVRVYGTPASGAIRLCLGQGCSGPVVEQRYRVDRPRYWR